MVCRDDNCNAIIVSWHSKVDNLVSPIVKNIMPIFDIEWQIYMIISEQASMLAGIACPSLIILSKHK